MGEKPKQYRIKGKFATKAAHEKWEAAQAKAGTPAKTTPSRLAKIPAPATPAPSTAPAPSTTPGPFANREDSPATIPGEFPTSQGTGAVSAVSRGTRAVSSASNGTRTVPSAPRGPRASPATSHFIHLPRKPREGSQGHHEDGRPTREAPKATLEVSESSLPSRPALARHMPKSSQLGTEFRRHRATTLP